jgi:hypothetical protein
VRFYCYVKRVGSVTNKGKKINSLGLVALLVPITIVRSPAFPRFVFFHPLNEAKRSF